jgi:hypothetical protein
MANCLAHLADTGICTIAGSGDKYGMVVWPGDVETAAFFTAVFQISLRNAQFLTGLVTLDLWKRVFQWLWKVRKNRMNQKNPHRKGLR